MPEPVWVDIAVVLAIHDEQLAEHGGASGVRDLGLLESALVHPRNRYAYKKTSLAVLAASYAHGIASNHPFLDGNKRTSFVVTELFLALNGVALTATDEAATVAWLTLAAGEISEKAIASWIAANSRPDPALANRTK